MTDTIFYPSKLAPCWNWHQSQSIRVKPNLIKIWDISLSALLFNYCFPLISAPDVNPHFDQVSMLQECRRISGRHTGVSHALWGTWESKGNMCNYCTPSPIISYRRGSWDEYCKHNNCSSSLSLMFIWDSAQNYCARMYYSNKHKMLFCKEQHSTVCQALLISYPLHALPFMRNYSISFQISYSFNMSSNIHLHQFQSISIPFHFHSWCFYFQFHLINFDQLSGESHCFTWSCWWVGLQYPSTESFVGYSLNPVTTLSQSRLPREFLAHEKSHEKPMDYLAKHAEMRAGDRFTGKQMRCRDKLQLWKLYGNKWNYRMAIIKMKENGNETEIERFVLLACYTFGNTYKCKPNDVRNSTVLSQLSLCRSTMFSDHEYF